MVSSCIVQIAEIQEVLPHPDPETMNLELVHVLGWQLVTQKGQYKQGQKIVYVPPDSVLPLDLSEKLNVTKYLSKQRIKCVKLRGEPSFGLAFTPDNPEWELGSNVADFYNITKWEPPLRFTSNDALVDHPLFPKYTDIENLRNFPGILEEGEEVVVSEKIHGTSARIGLIEGEWMAGSHQLRRKKPDNGETSLYWYPAQIPAVVALIESLAQLYRQVVLFGEIYGPKIQSLQYGIPQNKLAFRAFDIYLDGKYQDWDIFTSMCVTFGVETVPELARVPFSLSSVKSLSEGKTILMTEKAHIREGVVIKPLAERSHPKVGRVVLKYISDSYLLKSDKTDYTEQ